MLGGRIVARLAATVGVAAGLGLLVIGPQAAQAQTPVQQQALNALQTIGVPCTAYSSGLLECSGYNADNMYTDVRVHTDVADPNPTTVYVFDPYTGHSVHITLTVDDDGNIHLYGTDSESGIIDFTSGWLSVFYPTGNPFSAAVQSPANALFACNCLPGENDGGWPGGGGGGGGPGPILP
jgi:hypothetical protein